MPARDQGRCGSCWSFATMGQLEGMYRKNNGAGALNSYLSVQQLVDCDKVSQVCRGGYMPISMKYLMQSPPMFDKDYPYTASEGTCRLSGNTSRVRVTKVTYTGSYWYKYPPTLSVLPNGPLGILVGANRDFFNYSSGIFTADCLSGVNHAVILVGFGYDSSSGYSYYIVRNSWGPSWGENGDIRIAQKGFSCWIDKYGYQAETN